MEDVRKLTANVSTSDMYAMLCDRKMLSAFALHLGYSTDTKKVLVFRPEPILWVIPRRVVVAFQDGETVKVKKVFIDGLRAFLEKHCTSHPTALAVFKEFCVDGKALTLRGTLLQTMGFRR